MTDWPAVYLAQGIRMIAAPPRAKAPYRAESPDPATRWNVQFVDSVEAWGDFSQMHPGCNLALYCPGVQVDFDSIDCLPWGAAHGMSRNDGAWAVRTSRGIRFVYRAPDKALTNAVDATHRTPDLLAVYRLCFVPPAVHPSGKPYAWVKGHSPLDITATDLDPLPAPILDYWLSIMAPKRAPTPHIEAPSWLGLVFEAVMTHLESTGHRLRPLGNGGFSSTCPLHQERNPSFSIHPERGWKCFAGCGSGRLTELAAKLNITV